MDRPNVVLVLADDMGYSDIGCFGGEIRTPNLDAIARRGVRFSHFYNTARCSPSRASLITGLHPHQTGIGVLNRNDAPAGYRGALNSRCVTMAEVLQQAGYATCLSGKWHLTSDVRQPNESWPTRRGFEHFYGTLTGCGSFYQPGTLTRGELDASADTANPRFFYTDAIAAEADAFIRDQRRAAKPFFLYAAFTAPHWPLHAPEDDIASYEGVFDEGWDILRARRMQRLIDEGILPADTRLSDRDPAQPPWRDVGDKAWQVRRMQVYAAQIERMDRGIGRIVRALGETSALDDTLFIFLSDNGASAETVPNISPERFRARKDIIPSQTRDGRPILLGNSPAIVPGAEDTYASYGQAWANLSDTPFRMYKRWVHEGGIATPLVVSWPGGGVSGDRVVHRPAQLVDLMPTIVEATGADYPLSHRGHPITPMQGVSLLAQLRGDADAPERALYWEHIGNCAMRKDGWKIVREYPHDWELYRIAEDRTELHDVAAEHPAIVSTMIREWEQWAARCDVLPWDSVLRLYRSRGLTDEEAAGG